MLGKGKSPSDAVPVCSQRQVKPIGILQLSELPEEEGEAGPGRSESGVTLDVVDL